MKIEKIKEAMLLYTDFYGGSLLGISKIESAKTKQQLSEIIEEHRQHIEDQANDASCSLDRFKNKLGLP